MNQKQAKRIIKRVKNAPRNVASLEAGDFNTEPSIPGERSTFASLKVEVPHSIRPGVPLDLAIPAYEQITADGDGASSTYNLGHDLVDDPAMANDLVLYADGNRVEPDSINYDGDSFDYTDDGTQQTLDVFYLSGEQAEVSLRVVAPRNFWNEPISQDIGLHHQRDTNDDPVTFEPEKTALDGVAPTDYKFEWSINAPYEVRREAASGAVATNMVISVPVWIGQQEIPGLKALKSASIQ